MIKLSILIFLLVSAGSALANSTIDPDRALSWSSGLGWVDWHPSSEYGAVIGEFVCSGYLWAANIGWIHLGSGDPADGIYYANDGSGDTGVNRERTGRLRGFAWSPNIGWIVFEGQGDPRIDLRTGELRGAAWAPNAGWLFFGDAGGGNAGARALAIAPGNDSDENGLPDAWELYHAGALGVLSAEGDASGNGMTNREAYLADLDPFDPDARFRIIEVDLAQDTGGGRYDVTWTSRPSRVYRLWFGEDLTSWDQIGPAVIFPEEGEKTGYSHRVDGEMLPQRNFFPRRSSASADGIGEGGEEEVLGPWSLVVGLGSGRTRDKGHRTSSCGGKGEALP